MSGKISGDEFEAHDAHQDDPNEGVFEVHEFVHQEDCHPVSVEEVVKNNLKTDCVLCGSSIELYRAYMRGVEYCQHGAPMSFMAICPSCAMQMVMMDLINAGEEATGVTIKVGVADDFAEFLQKIDEPSSNNNNNKPRHMH